MAVTVNQLYTLAKNTFHTKLLTGDIGLNKYVRWFHIVEDITVVDFLRPGEIVLFVGNMLGNTSLLDFVKRLCEYKASAIIVGIGPYIKYIPDEVINFCIENNLPVMTHEWHIKMSEVTEMFAEVIIEEGHSHNTVLNAIKDIIFNTNNPTDGLSLLKRNGFSDDEDYRIIIIGNPDNHWNCIHSNDKISYFLDLIEHECFDFVSNVSIFLYQGNIVLVISQPNEDITLFSSHIINFIKPYLGSNIKTVVSRKRQGINSIAYSFKTALEMWHLCCKKDANILYEKDMGVYRLLFSVNDKDELLRFYDEILSNLKNYTVKNTNYSQLLFEYIQLNGNLNLIAKKHFVHRNTIQYHIEKIESLIGLNLSTNEDKLKVMLCMFIQDIL